VETGRNSVLVRQLGVADTGKPMTLDEHVRDYPDQVMDAASIADTLSCIADEISRAHEGNLDRVAFIGIRTRGVHLAERLAQRIEKARGVTVPCASMDVTLYRDDVTGQFPPLTAGPTSIEFNVTGMYIVLVDDVLFNGRTIRAALDQLIDFGRPAKIELAVLVDRGHRELPIQPDYVGEQVTTSIDETVRVNLTEEDGVDSVEVVPAGGTDESSTEP